MTIKDEINRQIKHIEAKIADMQAFNPYKTEETVNGMYWCGVQAATTTLDFMETLRSVGMLSAEDHTEYVIRIGNLKNLLVETHNTVKRKMKESTQEPASSKHGTDSMNFF